MLVNENTANSVGEYAKHAVSLFKNMIEQAEWGSFLKLIICFLHPLRRSSWLGTRIRECVRFPGCRSGLDRVNGLIKIMSIVPWHVSIQSMFQSMFNYCRTPEI